jgi:23S rRNA pseudouridine1911/1915/1917 synthase
VTGVQTCALPIFVVAKSDAVHIAHSRQLMERAVSRRYVALVWGEMPERAGAIDMPIGRSPSDRKKMAVVEGGREALTTYSVVDTYPPFQYIRLKLGTGRTHQIRVHLSRVGHPVLGDPVYGGRKPHRGSVSGKQAAVAEKALSMIDRQALHAEELSFVHPATGERMRFTAPLPDDFRAVLEFLRTA